MKRHVITVAAAVLAVSLLTAGGCEDSKGTCHPGDTRAGHGHVEKCGTDKKWHV